MSSGHAHEFDLLAIGTGPAASRVASKCVGEGWKVAIADKRVFGGTCALRGCNPKKVLVRSAELADWARRCQGKLIQSSTVVIDWKELIRFKESFTEPVARTSEAGYQKKGITTLHGVARFTSPEIVQVGDRTVKARHVVIAAGARPTPLDLEGQQYVTTSDEFLDLQELPPRILFIGGGYISFEFAHVAARAGADVTIVDRGPQVLKQFPISLVDKLVARSRDGGIRIERDVNLASIEKQADGSLSVHATAAGRATRYPVDLIVHGAGRVPDLEDMDLRAGNVEFAEGGIQVNGYLQSISNKRVYAAGDCADTGAPPLTPVANQQGRTIAQNLLEGNCREPDYGVVPTAVFTVPALASVGLTEQSAAEQDIACRVLRGDMSDWSSVKKVGETYAAYEILVEPKSDRILGAHLLGPHAEETINLFALAMKFGMTTKDLKSVLMVFPTFASDIRNML